MTWTISMPELLSAAQYPDSGFAAVVTMLLLVWFLLPLAAMIIGVIGLAVGYLLRRAASRPAQAGMPSAELRSERPNQPDETLRGAG